MTPRGRTLGRTLAAIAVVAVGLSGLAGCAGGRSRDADGATAKEGPVQIGVNAFLYRATLDTIKFMPLASQDPFGGVIITEWYATPERPNERFKATVYILDTRLRADALKVALFRQQLTANGWSDAPSDPEAALQIENAILTRARELRLASVEN